MLMLTCKEASYIVSQSLDRPLPLWTKIALRLHLLMCRNCSEFRRQMLGLSTITRRSRESLSVSAAYESAVLSKSSRARIKQFLAARAG